MYNNKYTIISLPGAFPEQCVRLWNAWTEVGGPTSVEREDERDLIVQPDSSGPLERSFVSNVDLTIAVPPHSVALSIQDNLLVGANEGWIFRSGRFTPELPSEPIECILPNPVAITQIELDQMLPAMPFVIPNDTDSTKSTIITFITAIITGNSINLDVRGTDSMNLPSGETFRYTATMNIFPNSSLTQINEPLDIALLSPGISFSGLGFPGFLNIINGFIIKEVNPVIKNNLKTRLNTSILAAVASSLSRGTMTTLPAGVVMSLRQVRVLSTSPNGPK
jgi:hypothetical protein